MYLQLLRRGMRATNGERRLYSPNRDMTQKITITMYTAKMKEVM